jgi:hypothetical protein
LVDACVPLHLFRQIVGTILLGSRACIYGFALLLIIVVQILSVDEQAQHILDIGLILILLLLSSGGRYHVCACTSVIQECTGVLVLIMFSEGGFWLNKLLAHEHLGLLRANWVTEAASVGVNKRFDMIIKSTIVVQSINGLNLFLQKCEVLALVCSFYLILQLVLLCHIILWLDL